jgi:hypothetical protein
VGDLFQFGRENAFDPFCNFRLKRFSIGSDMDMIRRNHICDQSARKIPKKFPQAEACATG